MGNLFSLLIIMVSCLCAYYLRFGVFHLPQGYLSVLLLTLVLSSIVLPATGAYRSELRWLFIRRTRRLLAGWVLVAVTLVALAAMLKVSANFSRIWFGYWVLFCALGLILWQAIEHSWLLHRRRHAPARRPVVLVGAGANGARVEQRLQQDQTGEFRIAARFGQAWNGQPVLPISELAEFIESSGVHDVWVALPLDSKGLLEQTLDALRESVVDLNVVPDLYQYRLLNQSITEWEGLPVVNLSGTPMTAAERRLKFAFDLVGAALLVLLLSPLLLMIALLIRLTSKGPVIFRQERHGMDGEPIHIYKFRTMSATADTDGTFVQARKDDERVTGLGRYLRKTSLDELPQLFNVLKGEMSLVGPRPHPLKLNQDFKARIPRYMLRHRVRPGMTGWAQVNGFRGETDTEEKMALRIEHDLWYIQNWSLWLDLRILLLTPLAMIHRNAI